MFQRLSLALLVAVLLTQFNNCGNYAEPALGIDDSSSSLNCLTPNCISPNAEFLKVTPHLESDNGFQVTANLDEFNIGGDCNEGGYPFNKVRWELVLNGNVVRHSGMRVVYDLGLNQWFSADSQCTNGRFLLYINLVAIPDDNFDRRGLADGSGSSPAVRSSYDLNIILYGQNTQNSQEVFQSPQGRTTVTLDAI